MNQEIDFLRLYEKVFYALTKGSIQKILEEAYQITGVPILAVDIVYNVLGIVPPVKTGDSKWDYLLEHRGFDTDMALQEYRDGTMQSVNYKEAPYVIDWGGDNVKYPKILGLIRVGGMVEGYITMQCHPKEINDNLLKAMEIIQEACSLLYREKDSENSMDEIYQKAFTKELFSNRMKTQQQLDSWERDTQFLPKPLYRIAAIGTRAAKEKNVLTFIRKSVQHMVSCLVVIQNNILYILLYELKKGKKYQSIKRQTENLLNQMNAYCGVSNEFDDLLKFHDYQMQAEDAMRLGFHFHSTERVSFFKNLYLPAILAPRIQNMPACNYISPIISRVEEYDSQHGTNLYETLELYVKNLCHTTKTANQLHIHRNSLMYRVNKIEEIAGQPIEETKTFMHLMISFYMMEYKIS